MSSTFDSPAQSPPEIDDELAEFVEQDGSLLKLNIDGHDLLGVLHRLVGPDRGPLELIELNALLGLGLIYVMPQPEPGMFSYTVTERGEQWLDLLEGLARCEAEISVRQ